MLTKEEIAAIAAVVKEMGDQGFIQKNDPASTTPTAPMLHGTFPGNEAQYGLFSTPGIRPEILATLARPRTFVQAILSGGGLSKSVFDKERLEVLTGVTAASGTNATGFCGNPPTVGQGKIAEIDYEWGEWYMKTNLNVVPKIGGRRDRADVPRQFLNVAPEQRNPLIPSVMYELPDSQSQLRYENWLIGVQMERTLGKVAIQGDSSLSSTDTELGFISEYEGLDRLIKTGYTDAKTGQAVPALDSMVISFNADVAGTIGGGDGRNLVQAVSDLIWSGMDRARAYGMDGATWALVMRPEQWRPFIAAYSTQYNTYGSSTTVAGVSLNDNLDSINRMRIEMERGMFVLVDGLPIPVVFEEGIPREQTAANTFKSDIYYVPVEWNGVPLTRFEYFDMDNANLQEFASFVSTDKFTTLNNGMYLVGYRYTPLCLEYHYAARMRMILELPSLAGRLDDVHFTTRTLQRLADPGDTNFYANGGRTFNS